jgi:hypothetical protein
VSPARLPDRLLPPRRDRIAPSAAAAVGLALALCGCAHPTTFAHSGRAVPVILTEYRLRPSWVSVPAGRVTFRIRNLGRLAHNLIVGDGSRALASSPPLAPGATARLTVKLAPGTYRLLSNVHNDETLGLRARLTVTRG